MKPVCLVMGAGAGIGGSVGRRFALEGYHAVLCRRSDQEGLDKLVAGIESEGGSASAAPQWCQSGWRKSRIFQRRL